MTRLFFHYRVLITCLLFIGSMSVEAQVTKGPTNIKKQCLQKMKLFTNKVIFTKDQSEEPLQSEIVIDPINFSIKVTFQEPDKPKAVSEYMIEGIKCNINEDLTSGNITYEVVSDNHDGSVSSGGFILEAQKDGLFFSGTIDPPQNRAVLPIAKYEIK